MIHSSRFLRRVVFLLFVVAAAPLGAVSPNVVVSQVYGGGGNSGATYKNDFVELFNRSAATVSLTGWSVQYSSAAGTTWQVTNLTGSIAPGKYFLVQEAVGAGGTTNLPTPDAVGVIPMSATAGKIALVNTTTALMGACPTGGVVDFVGFGATASCFEGTAATPAPSNTAAVFRASGGCADTDQNGSDFTAGAPSPRNAAATAAPCAGGGITLSIGDVAHAEGSSGTTTFTFTVSLSAPAPAGGVTFNVATQDGTATVADADYAARSLVGQSISAGSSTYTFDVIVNGDATVEPNETFFVNVTNVVGTGVTIADGQGVGTILNDDFVLTPIHDVQGNGASSPLAGQTVSTPGIVTGLKTNGFFLQAPDADADADPNTSEGVFVFTSSAPPAAAAVGNAVVVTGVVQEFVPSSDPNSPPATELTGPSVVLLSTGNSLPAAVVLTPSDLDPAGPIGQLEKYEGMRVKVASLTVVGPTQGTVNEVAATATSNGVFYGVLTGTPRPFREPGVEIPDPLPPGAPAGVPRFDANPERIRVDSDGLVGGTNLEVTSGATVTNLVGPLDYSFRTYTILPDPGSAPGVSGNVAATPVPAPLGNEFTVASFNMERFFDTVDDPSVSDVALTPTAFANRLNKASLAIRDVLRAPDILGVEEVENLTTLQAIATKVNADAVTAGGPDPGYQAYLVEGNDIGGIDVGFLVKSSRVSVVDVTQFGKTQTYTDPGTGQPALLNDRPPLLLRATVPAPSGPAFPITVIVNHLRSLSGVDDLLDGERVRAKRRAQAESVANLVQARQDGDPLERIIAVGDFNAFQVNDGYVDVLGTVKGTPAAATDVVLASPDLVDPDMTDLLDLMPGDQRYSYSFDGNAQALDHELVNAALKPFVSRAFFARSNTDFPETYRNDPNRPERLSDHDMAVAYIRLAAAPTAVVSGDASICAGGAGATIQAALTGTPPWSLTWSDGAVQSGIPASPATRLVNPAGTTTYTVTAVADANGPGTASGSAEVVVGPAPATPVVTAPAAAPAGGAGRVASVPAHAGSTYLWTILNGSLTAGQGTHQVTFTAGAAGAVALGVTETSGAGCVSPPGGASVEIVAPGGALLFETVAPCRLVDTRSADGPLGGPALPAAGGADRVFVLTGACGIPAGAAAVSANLTVVSPAAAGSLSLVRGDAAPSGIPSLAFNAGRTRANGVLLPLAPDGSVRVSNAAPVPVHVTLDVNGAFR